MNKRWFAFCSLSCFAFLAFVATPIQASNFIDDDVGIAFIHGTSDHRLDADGDYWKKSFIQSIVDVLPNPRNHLIVACDFTHDIWDPAVAGCLSKQITTFVHEKKIRKLYVYSHSHGGNIIRWILSNPSYDPEYPLIIKTIKQVTAIAPSSGGTELADEVCNGNVFNKSVGWLLGYRNDAIKQQRVGEMALLNAEVLLGTPGRPSLPCTFRSVVGTDVFANPLSQSSYCNGYMLNSGLKFTKTYLDDCSDGFISCFSQAHAGKVWFYDREKTDNQLPLNHNQSRHSCFYFDQIIRNDIIEQGVIR
ncbi:MAG: hypothetical protein H2069_02105 [Legionella sp.]|nr:hypothetical protein [Legionella sp.]